MNPYNVIRHELSSLLDRLDNHESEWERNQQESAPLSVSLDDAKELWSSDVAAALVEAYATLASGADIMSALTNLQTFVEDSCFNMNLSPFAERFGSYPTRFTSDKGTATFTMVRDGRNGSENDPRYYWLVKVDKSESDVMRNFNAFWNKFDKGWAIYVRYLPLSFLRWFGVEDQVSHIYTEKDIEPLENHEQEVLVEETRAEIEQEKADGKATTVLHFPGEEPLEWVIGGKVAHPIFEGKAFTYVTEEEAEKWPALYSQESVKQPPMVLARYFTASNWTWWLLEYEPETGNAFGIVDGFEMEMGTFSIAEWLYSKKPFSTVERDLWFEPKPITEVDELSRYHGLYAPAPPKPTPASNLRYTLQTDVFSSSMRRHHLFGSAIGNEKTVGVTVDFSLDPPDWYESNESQDMKFIDAQYDVVKLAELAIEIGDNTTAREFLQSSLYVLNGDGKVSAFIKKTRDNMGEFWGKESEEAAYTEAMDEITDFSETFELDLDEESDPWS